MKSKYIVLSFTFLLFVSSIFIGCSNNNKLYSDDTDKSKIVKPNEKKEKKESQSKTKINLPIPALLEDTNPDSKVSQFELVAQESQHSFYSDQKTDTFAFNGSYLGPTIKVKREEQVKINVKNKLKEPTTVHWHGLHIPAEMDGNPHQLIKANDEWNVDFPIKQQAGTYWYHPHLMGKTGEQVYRGMAGFFIVEDEVSESLNIPKTYGVDDIPLVIQDKLFRKDRSLNYTLRGHDILHGFTGNTLIVNGAIKPVLKVKAIKMRFRILNGSNGTLYLLALSNDKKFQQIASDGGFLEKPVELDNMLLSPGERGEIIVDFSNHKIGDKIELQLKSLRSNNRYEIMTFEVVEKAKDNTIIPKVLTEIERYKEDSSVQTRQFVLNSMSMGRMMRRGGMGMHNRNTINGKNMDMNRIDEKVKLDTVEVWDIINTSPGMFPHSFHVHDVQFQILSINGEAPPENESGWKDTVLVWPGDRIKIISKFKDYTGIYMYHCHILEHEDDGMMGQFEVVK